MGVRIHGAVLDDTHIHGLAEVENVLITFVHGLACIHIDPVKTGKCRWNGIRWGGRHRRYGSRSISVRVFRHYGKIILHSRDQAGHFIGEGPGRQACDRGHAAYLGEQAGIHIYMVRGHVFLARLIVTGPVQHDRCPDPASIGH